MKVDSRGFLTHFFHIPIFCEKKNHPENKKNEEKVTFSFQEILTLKTTAAALDQMSLLSYGNSLSAKPLGFRGPWPRINGASLRANPQRAASRAQGVDQLFD